MQAEEYQRRLKILLSKREGQQKDYLERKEKYQIRDKQRLDKITEAYKEAERLRREAAAIEAVVKEEERIIAEEEERECERLRKIAEEEA